MSMSFGLLATLNTSQRLTPQMQQAIKLLQLSSLELAQEVQLKLDSNPLLERIEDDDDDFTAIPDTTLNLDTWNSDTGSSSANDTEYNSDDSYDDSNYADDSYSNDDAFSNSFDKLQQSSIEDNVLDNGDINNDYQDIDFGSDLNRIDSGNYAASSVQGSHAFDELDDYQGSTSACIQDHVRWQLNFKHLSDTDTLIANYLMDSMDDMGFIQLDINELLQSFTTVASFYQWDNHVERDEIMAVLRVIQSCDPLGVGARTLSECLALQLAKLDKNTENLAHAVALLSASEHLVSNNIKALTDATGLLPENITPALQLLRTLNPAPGLLFQSSQPDYTQPPASYDIPDIIVTPIGRSKADSVVKTTVQTEGWYVRLNPETLPKLRVNQEYASLVKRGDNSPDNQYLRDNLMDARLFIRSIEERNQNLLKVATSIVRRQQAFLQHGATSMQPLILKEVADEVELHESTVSRLTTSKIMLTPQGLFSLKHFFSSHVSSSDGDISSTAISAMIKQLITDENPKKPLSDSRIQAQLLADGIDIARRTVAKYREAMNIGSSTQRKQKY
ncbi:RNA polymerase factor sigma-54 [Psychrobacter sp. GP33]|uniref:RNA polymerase factor sigma-54 n=1 Tax=Psychrobacter sp. GP33 TaxID=2758709 RepID=UPI0015F7CD45|nr:RNA polymerase factor sigma-54 [Psychrobacter sp. GP33]